MFFLTLLVLVSIWACVTTVVALIRNTLVAKALLAVETLLIIFPLPLYYIFMLASGEGDPTARAGLPIVIVMSIGFVIIAAAANLGVWVWCSMIPRRSSYMGSVAMISALPILFAELAAAIPLLLETIDSGPSPAVIDIAGPLAWMLLIPIVTAWLISQRGAIRSFLHPQH